MIINANNFISPPPIYSHIFTLYYYYIISIFLLIYLFLYLQSIFFFFWFSNRTVLRAEHEALAVELEASLHGHGHPVANVEPVEADGQPHRLVMAGKLNLSRLHALEQRPASRRSRHLHRPPPPPQPQKIFIIDAWIFDKDFSPPTK